MIIGNKTLTTRYILPFLFENSSIFNDEHNFVNAYVADINRPYIENSIFVVFEYNPKVYDTIDGIMTTNNYFYDKQDIFIDNTYYVEYIFLIPFKYKDAISLIKKGSAFVLPFDKKEKILNFWGNINYSYLKDLITKRHDITEYKSLEESGEVVTEEDYIDDANELALKYLLDD